MRFQFKVLFSILICLASCREPNDTIVANSIRCGSSNLPYLEWREQELESFKKAKYQTGGGWIYNQLTECAANNSLEALGGNLLKFSESYFYGLKDGHSMRFATSDSQYLKKIPSHARNLPDELTKQDFLRSLDLHLESNGQMAINYLVKLNESRSPDEQIRYFIFDSQFLPTADASASYKRLFVYFPAETVDKFIQFGLHNDIGATYSNTISMIAVEKLNPETSEQHSTPIAWFKDFWRLRDQSIISISTRLKESGQLESCYGCHSSALLKVLPDRASFDSERFEEQLTAVNNKIDLFKNAQIAEVSPDNFGPALGPLNNEGRTDSLFTQCASGLADESIAKVNSAMNCSQCHNDTFRKALRYPMAQQSQIDRDSIMKVLIEDEKSMPPATDLSDEERKALTRCLVEEYFSYNYEEKGLLEKWFLE